MVHCLAHFTSLCLQSVAKQSLHVREALDLVMELSQLIRFSPKKLSLFEALDPIAGFSKCTDPEITLSDPLDSAHSAMKSVLKNYSLLQDALEVNSQGTDEYTMKTVGYLNFMQKFSTYMYILCTETTSSCVFSYQATFSYSTRQRYYSAGNCAGILAGS